MPADLANINAFFQRIPNTLWSGVAASLATLIGTLAGVIVTNISNTKRLRIRLDHDASEKQKERLSTLRRSLYLKATEATVRANAYFGGMTQLDVTKAGFDMPFRDVLAAAAQMQLVLNQSTAQLISGLVSIYGELQIRLITKVVPIHVLKSNIDTISALYIRKSALTGGVRWARYPLPRAANDGSAGSSSSHSIPCRITSGRVIVSASQ